VRASGRPHAAQALAEARAFVADTDIWSHRLFELFSDELRPDDLLAAAATDDERAEACYYIGCKALLDGDQDAARAAFEKCLALERDGILETAFARFTP